MNDRAVPDPLLVKAERLYDLGLYLQVQPLLPELERSPEPRARLLAVRTIGHLGARREADARLLRLWRGRRDDGPTTVAFLRYLLQRRGPYGAWRHSRAMPQFAAIDPVCEADRLSLRAFLLGTFRDFRNARAAYDEARRIAPQECWPQVEWSHVCEMADRYDEGLAVAEEALRSMPGYRPAIQAVAHLKTLLGRDDEALAQLEEASRTTESGSIHAQLLDLQIEKGLYADAWATLDRSATLHPRADKSIVTWLAARRTDVALHLGRLPEARKHALAVGDDSHRRLAERLAAGTAGLAHRVLLPVGFIRQHHMTCAPATLASISGYWSHPADQLEIAEQICYDGTPNHSERCWAEAQGFMVREFTVDWPTARALVDAGVPFTLTTVWTGGAHLQAVVGYDELRGTLLIRDPFKRLHGEFEAEALFASHRSSGPRGMVLLPTAQAKRIDAIALPEAQLWDGYHQVMTALGRHDRVAAVAAAREMTAHFSGHRLAIAAGRSIAIYDGDESAVLAATEALLALFPTDVNLQLSKAASLTLVADRAHQLEWLATIAEPANAEPLAMVRHAQVLAQDGRESPRAARIVRRTLARIPTEAAAWSCHADILWQQGARDAAIEHYRGAACLQDTNEDYAVAYFRATHFVRRTEAGLDFLRERADRLGAKSAAPTITLFLQLEVLERTDEAFRLLDQALARRGDDADLLLFAADSRLRYGGTDEARDLLRRVQRPAKRASRLRIEAQLAQEAGNLAGALSQAREASALEPLNIALHRLVASLLARSEGRSQAIAHLRGVITRFDHHAGLHELLIEWLEEEPPADGEAVLRRLVDINPSSAWAQRELAINLARQNRCDEALAVMDAVMAMAADHSSTHSTLGFIRLRQGRVGEAQQHMRDALTLSIDNDYALNALVDSGATLAQRQDALAFVRRELVRQVTMGDSLLAFQGAAQRTLPPDEVLAVMREAHNERPDLWQSWVALASQLIDMGKLDEAIATIAEAIERFPLLPRLRMEEGRALALLGRRDSARASFKAALQINPQWTSVVRLYVDTVLDEGQDFERALAVLDTALARNPEDAELHRLRSWTRWRHGDRPAAVAELRHALMLDPRTHWGWVTLQRFAADTGDRDLPAQVTLDLVRQRAGDVWSWVRRAEHADDRNESLAAIDRALELEPRSQAAYETRLTLLMNAGRVDDVDAALASHPWQEAPPIAIRVFAARVARARNDPDEAFRILCALSAEDPNNYALWEELADGYDQAGKQMPYLEAAKNLVRLAPNFHKAHGYLADALRRADRHAEAREHFERAFQLDPSYAFAGLNLTDLYLDGADAEKAEATLAVLARHGRDAFLAAREIRLAVLKGDREAAGARLGEVFGNDTAGDWPSRAAIDALHKAGWDDRLEQGIAACFADGTCTFPAVHFWLERQTGGWLPGAFYRKVRRALGRDPHHALMRGLLDFIGARQDVALLDRLLRDYRAVLREDQACWSQVGYALLSTNQHARLANWMSNWRERPDTPAWSLDNLAVALRSLGRHEAARAPTLRSLELAPDNLDARTWLAVDAARADRIDELDRLLAGIDPGQVRVFYRNLLIALRAYLQAAQAKDSRKALAGFRSMAAPRKESRALQQLMRLLARRLVRRYTPLLLRPLRWLQFALA